MCKHCVGVLITPQDQKFTQHILGMLSLSNYVHMVSSQGTVRPLFGGLVYWLGLLVWFILAYPGISVTRPSAISGLGRILILKRVEIWMAQAGLVCDASGQA